MQDEQLTALLRDWSKDQLPDDDTRNKILRNVIARPSRRSTRWIFAAALSGAAAIATTLLFLLTPPLEDGRQQTADSNRAVDKMAHENIQV